MLAIFFVGAIVTYFMLPYDWFMEIIGFLATFIEAMLGNLREMIQLIEFVCFMILKCVIPQVLPNSYAISKENPHKECQL